MRLALLIGLALTAPNASADKPSTLAAKQALSAASGRALQGNAAEAAGLLSAVPEAEFSEADKRVRNCMIERFQKGSAADRPAKGESLLDQVISEYRTYWHAALMQPAAKADAEERLTKALRQLLKLGPDADWNRVEAELGNRAAAQGYHTLMGRTPPLLELMVWKSEMTELREVPLPEGKHRMTVKVLDDFASLGWSAYATCERSFTGGWVKPEAIYAVRPGWKSLTEENYLVSFLAHETQHFADKERFGELPSWELEYRAKLAELALADTTLPRLLSAFASNQGDDPEVPHSYANRLVVSRLREKLGMQPSADLTAVERASINRAARALLLEDTKRRTAERG